MSTKKIFTILICFFSLLIVVSGVYLGHYYLTSNRADRNQKEIALLIKKAVGAKRVVIAIENNKPLAIKGLQKVTSEYDDIEIGGHKFETGDNTKQNIFTVTLGFKFL